MSFTKLLVEDDVHIIIYELIREHMNAQKNNNTYFVSNFYGVSSRNGSGQ